MWSDCRPYFLDSGALLPVIGDERNILRELAAHSGVLLRVLINRNSVARGLMSA